jgi:hypothetical protein
MIVNLGVVYAKKTKSINDYFIQNTWFKYEF